MDPTEAPEEPIEEDLEPAGPFGLPCGHTIPERRSGPVWCGSCRRWWPIPPLDDEITIYESEPLDEGEIGGLMLPSQRQAEEPVAHPPDTWLPPGGVK
jgi:hypothetical protein